jgi:HEAT repeat protein
MTNEPEAAPPTPEEQLAELLFMLESDSLRERLTAIRVLGEIGNLAALQKLWERLGPVNQELQEEAIAVGKLKKRLGQVAKRPNTALCDPFARNRCAT